MGNQIDLGKGVSLKGASLNYEERIGPIDLKVKQKLKGKPLIKVGSKFKVGRATVDIGARKKGKDVSGGIDIVLPFSEGSKGKTIGKTLDDLLKKTPANRNLRNARAARDSGLDRDVWSGFLTNKQKQIIGIK
tara:strand:+ start:361 stop:759 length:399 start_codon:yes stop_codon:yes gene_type:complete